MNPIDLPAHQLAAFARPVLEYLPAGFDAEDAAQAESDDVGSLAALASPGVVAARIGRLGAEERDLTGALTISWPEAAAEVFTGYQREHQAWRSGAPELRDDHGLAGLAAATRSLADVQSACWTSS
ncbi:hypothetical protein [Arthrobacter sp. TB 26]|uniref:hypothetical protein n=1 Tax=Arthrobacter sp. TB 26 TaxID=494420 RepID=UPI00040864BE|nr:hypothetical protein [Arthrobacter sp. TB 26]